MARYFQSKEEAIREIREGLPKFGVPVFFGRVRNNNFGTEQWMVDYDVRDYGSAFTILENSTSEPLDAAGTQPKQASAAAAPEPSSAGGKQGFLRRLFGGGGTAIPLAPTEGSNWYFTRDEARSQRQVVLLAAPESKTSSRFGTFFLASKYSDLMVHPIVTGLFRLDGEPGPHLMIRTDGTRDDGYEAVEEMVKYPFRIAFTFQHLPTSGVLSLFVGSKFLRAYSQRGYLEMHYGIDQPETRSLVADAFHEEVLLAVHAREFGAGLTAKYDLAIPVEEACRSVLAREWESLLAHHAKIARPDFPAATRRIFELFPKGSDPIVPAPSGRHAD